MAVSVNRAAHDLAARTPIAAVAGYLQDALGQRLTAVIARVSDTKAVGQWAKGTRRPHPEVETRLRHAFQVVQLLMQVESSETVRAWFLGMNPELDDQSPAMMIAEDPQAVLQAAKFFLAHG
ncbi:MAG: XRE family transcriptional regulator [Chloroflexota bacterium]